MDLLLFAFPFFLFCWQKDDNYRRSLHVSLVKKILEKNEGMQEIRSENVYEWDPKGLNMETFFFANKKKIVTEEKIGRSLVSHFFSKERIFFSFLSR